MKLNPYTPLILLLALAAGCTSTVDPAAPEELMGMREQRSLLAKAQPLQEFGFSPSLPFGNDVLYIGSTLLEADQLATRRFEPGGIPLIMLQDASGRNPFTVLLDTASNTSWMQYSCAQRNDVTFLSSSGQPIPFTRQAGIDAYAGVAPLLRIDDLTLNNTPFYIRMARGSMQAMVYSSTPPRVEAVLGYDNLRQFEYIRVDLLRGMISFSTSTAYEPDSERLIGKVSISGICRDKLAVEGSVAGEAVPVVLDFAGDFSFARGDTRDPVTRQVELGEVVFLNVTNEALSAQDKYPRAGRRMLEKYTVIICPREGVVYFERPAG